MDASIVPALSECRFYHAMDLPGFGSIEGDWDLRGRFDEYIGGIDLRGQTVLDVGTASGFLSFEAERRGATVFSFDADGPERIQVVPPAMPDVRYFHGMRNSYRLAHHAFQSKATPIHGDIYRMSEVVPPCDVVIVGQILVHLRDPLGALHQAALAAKETLVIVEGIPEGPSPISRLRTFWAAKCHTDGGICRCHFTKCYCRSSDSRSKASQPKTIWGTGLCPLN